MDRKTFLKTGFFTSLASAILPRLCAETEQKFSSQKLPKDVSFCQRVFKVNTPSKLRIQIPEKFKKDVLQNPQGFKLVCLSSDRYAMSAKKRLYIDFPLWRRSEKIDKMNYENALVDFEIEEDRLLIDVNFANEDLYVMELFKKDSMKKPIFKEHVFAVKEDLFDMRPFKGDMHMHSIFSDGKNTPEEMGHKCLQLGMDFQALSDHNKYEGSQHLMEAFKDLNTSLKILNAEEVHVSAVHVHSIGSDRSITNWVNENKETFSKSVEKILSTLPKNLDSVDARDIAETEAAFDLIRSFGGIAQFNHPYWYRGDECMHVSKTVREEVFNRKNFDSIEVVNSLVNPSATDLILSHVMELLLKGADYSIISDSDAHSITQIGGAYTIVFAKSKDFKDLKASILDKKNVAVDNRPEHHPEIFGNRRYVFYADFLIKNYYPSLTKLKLDESEILALMLPLLKEKDSEKFTTLNKELAEKSDIVKKYSDSFFG